MAPLAKENEILSAAPETALRPSAASISADNPNKPQAVALEVEVTVNGARTVEGSDKREPFSETTKTVLVFGNGAVIRLASSVTPGQLLFLTNERTKKEVVCQVVKSKNYRNVSGYVELEFTESVVGFWGMRFPSDRIGTASPPAVGSSATVVAPPVQRPATPVITPPAVYVAPTVLEQKSASPTMTVRNSEPQLSASKFVAPPAPVIAAPALPKPEAPFSQIPNTPASLMPELMVNAPPVKPNTPISSTFDLPRTPEAHASIFAPPRQASAAPPAVEVASLSSVLEANLAPPPAQVPPVASGSNSPGTEGLKQQTARLQEQLSSLQFMDPQAAKPAQQSAAPPVSANTKPLDPFADILQFAKLESVSLPAKPAEQPPAPAVVTNTKPFDPFAEISQFAKSIPAPAPPKPAELPKIAPSPVKSLLDEEELKIPSWLEPLARNAAAPVSTQELVEREKTKRVAELSSVEEIASDAAGVAEEEHVSELHMPNFGSELTTDASGISVESGSRKSGKGMLFAAIAAGVLLSVGGGVWYFRQQSSGVQAGAAGVQKQSPVVSVPAQPLQTQNNVALQTNTSPTSPATQANLPLETGSNANPSKAEPVGAAFSPVNNKQVIPNSTKGASPLENSSPSQPEAAQPKKSALGEVRLAAPKVSQRGKSQDSGEAEAGLAMVSDPAGSNEGALGAGLASNTSQPAAPAPALPVGGDVKQARLIASVPPVYPTLAKNQHVSGDVRIDALIDATGRVTTMKVVSGPTLLHQAAMDALRQWKYQPASLNGNTVQMHLTVTIQFRLQ